MASFNKVILVGNLTRDPELRVTGTGLSICKIGLAVNRSYTSKEGESKDETTFVDVDVFGKQAEILGKYMQKGRPLMVEGRLKLDQWESNDGQKRSKLGVVLESFQFLGGRDDNVPRSTSASQSNTESTSNDSKEDSFDEDVPF